MLFTALPATAATLELGSIVFGVANNTENDFVLNNLTGDCGGAVGVCTPAILQNVVVSITPSGGSAFNVNMGNLPANSTTFSSALTFPNSQQFDLVTLAGTSSVTSFLLANGDTFLASSSNVFATLVSPSLGDSAPILIEGDIVQAPEPVALVLFGPAVVAAMVRRRHARAERS
jgi:hypothetical protein